VKRFIAAIIMTSYLAACTAWRVKEAALWRSSGLVLWSGSSWPSVTSKPLTRTIRRLYVTREYVTGVDGSRGCRDHLGSDLASALG